MTVLVKKATPNTLFNWFIKRKIKLERATFSYSDQDKAWYVSIAAHIPDEQFQNSVVRKDADLSKAIQLVIDACEEKEW